MPDIMSVAEFLAETKEDYNSPTTSTFVGKMSSCRQTVATLEETLDFDRDGLTKMKKAVKAIYNSGNLHVDNATFLAKALEKLGGNALTKDQEPDIGAAFLKFSVVTKELSALMKSLMQNINNIVMFPLDNLLKGDLRGVKGDLKKPFDKAWKDYETKVTKLEKEKKQQAKEVGLIRTEISPAEIAEEMEKERRMFQLQMCEYLVKVNEIKTKKGSELLQHLVEYYHAQNTFFTDGLKTIEHFNKYIEELAVKLQKIKQKQDEERKKLLDLRSLLKNSPTFEREPSCNNLGYSLHQPQGNKQHGSTKVGYLMKKSESKMRKVWQKRKCEIRDGFLFIAHSDESKTPVKLNLLTCQVKMVPEEKRCFDLVSHNRTYHFQAEDELEMEAWMSVLINSKEEALMKAFGDSGKEDGTANQSLLELTKGIIKEVIKLPGNDRCCDCNTLQDPSWLVTNFGIVTCIECSGIHRDLGVHISRVQSLTLDNVGTSQLLLAKVVSNIGFNDVMEATLDQSRKPTPSSTMAERDDFIRAKYVDHKYAVKTCTDADDLKLDLKHAILAKDIYSLLQVFAEGVDLNSVLPRGMHDETALHLAVQEEDGTSLHIVDFLVQNSRNLDKVTSEGNTALHLCALLNQVECLKLLLRSGADCHLENNQGQTALDIARENGFHMCEELLKHALSGKKDLFEHVDIDWGLSQEEHAYDQVDFSDDELDEKMSDKPFPEKMERVKVRSRPSSLVGLESPVTTRQRSQVVSAGAGSPNSQRSMPPPPPPAKNKPAIGGLNMQGGSVRKRSAPLPPTTMSHTRTPSDSSIQINTAQLNRVSGDPNSSPSSEVPPALPPKITTVTRSHSHDATSLSNNNEKPGIRNRGPLPPLPHDQNWLSNGRSNESISSVSSLESASNNVPVPPPRRLFLPLSLDNKSRLLEDCYALPIKKPDPIRLRRCRALYDCEADNDDELSFKEGEVIIITNENTDDENWMEGMIENCPDRRGMFPVSFVHMLIE